MRVGQVAIAAALLVSITHSPAGLAQFSVEGTDGSTVNIGPGGINVRSSSGKQASVGVGRSGITVKSNRPRPAGSIGMRRGPSIVDLKTALALLEKAAYGKTNETAPLITRIERLEVDNIGSKGSGPNIPRVEALAKTLGVNITLSTTTATQATARTRASETIVDSGASTRVSSTTIPAGGLPASILSITDNNHEGTLTCNDSAVAVASNHCNLVLTGHCRLLNVTGNHNTIRADHVDNIQALGNHNTIVWVRTPAPAISNQGNYNRIAKASP